MARYKEGKYQLQRQPDLFKQETGELHLGETIVIHLTEKEAKDLFKNGLYSRLGFVGWSLIE